MFFRLAALGWAALLVGLLPGAAAAQHIAIAGGPGGVRALAGPNSRTVYRAGAPPVGGNLFDSIVNFNVPAGQTAVFVGPGATEQPITDIIVGVTGGTRSTIDGTVKSGIAGANFYLINPSGVVFGPGAKIRVSGSFYASTADYLKLGGNGRFNLTHRDGSTLAAAAPSAFGFLKAMPAAITVGGARLGSVPGTLGLVGGPISVKDRALARAGAIDVVAVAAKGEVPVDPWKKAAIAVRRFGAVHITGRSRITVVAATGGRPAAGAAGLLSVTAGRLALLDRAKLLSTARRGRVVIRARALSITEGGAISASTSGPGHGGAVSVDVAGRLTINGAGPSFTTGIIAQAHAGSTGSAGDVTVAAGTLQVLRGGVIASTTSGSGKGGTVAVRVVDRLTINGAGSSLWGITAQSYGRTGNAGDITVAAGTLDIVHGGQISGSTFGRGNGGQVSISADRLTINGAGSSFTGIASASEYRRGGNAGDITVAARTLDIVHYGEISDHTFGSGDAGHVSISAERLTIHGAGSRFTGIDAGSQYGSSGNAGNITVAAGTLDIVHGGAIASNTEGSGNGGHFFISADRLTINGAGSADFTGITAQALLRGSVGSAGDITVAAGTVEVVRDGVIASDTYGSGDPGHVSIRTDRLTINGVGSTITSGSYGSKSAGDITVAAGTLDIVNGGAISNETYGSGNGGDISVTARISDLAVGGLIASDTHGSGNGGHVSLSADRLAIDGAGSAKFTGITAQAFRRSIGSAGDITVAAGTLDIVHRGQIASATYGAGNGGHVSLRADRLAIVGVGPKSFTGVTLAAFRSGSAGDITVAAGTLDIVHGGQIFSSASGSAEGGDISVKSRISDLAAGGVIRSDTFGSGDAGHVSISADRLAINGAGSANSIGITAQTYRGSIGSAGDITVAAGSLDIVQGGVISASTSGPGRGGRISIDVARGLTIDGAGTHRGSVTGIVSQANKGSSGNAGDAVIRSGKLTIEDGGKIANSVLGVSPHQSAGSGNAGAISVDVADLLMIAGAGSSIATATGAGTIGSAGLVTVRAGQITLTAGGDVVSTTAGSGGGGQTGISASDIVLMGPGRQITAMSTGTGDAGVINVSAAQLLMSDGAAISTAAQSASGGNITLTVGDLLALASGEVTTSVKGNTADSNGGNIVIASGLTILDHARIIAKAVAGHGGAITINRYGGAFVASVPPDSTVSATSQKGISGVVEINGITPLNGALVALSSELRSAVALAASSCAAHAGRPQSSLVAAGRGGLPQDPDATLPALYIAGRDLRLAPPSQADGGGELRSMLPAPARCG